MQLALFLSLLIAVAAVVFAMQNPTVVQLRFLRFHLEGSVALLMLLSFGMGFLCNALLAVPRAIRRRRAITDLKKRIAALERESAPELKAIEETTVPR